ncbi:MAG: hypothetical protein ACI841_003458 [Planctomycetota bacterium]|jgi:hypothetical protein
MTEQDKHTSQPPKRRRIRRVMIRLSIVLLVTSALFEVGLRVLLFSDNSRIANIARDLRSPGNFGHRWSTQYWKLQYLFSNRENRKPPPNVDKRVGWRGHRLDAKHRHKELDSLGASTPVMLYGDSFAERTSWETTWSSLLESSDQGADRKLLNFGVGGYGFDQAFLSFMFTIDSATKHDPIVVMSVLIDDDLDRANLAFRGWPKPYLDPDATGFDFSNGLGVDSETWLNENPPKVSSYAWRYLIHGAEFLPAPWRNKIGGRLEAWADTRRVCRKILSKLDREFRKRKLQSFVLIFHGKGQLEKGADSGWRESFMTRELDRLGLPYVSTRTDFERDRKASKRKWTDYVAEKGDRRGHYTEVGNEVSFLALERGLRGEFDGSGKILRRGAKKD